jgi:hypothetical protein
MQYSESAPVPSPPRVHPRRAAATAGPRRPAGLALAGLGALALAACQATGEPRVAPVAVVPPAPPAPGGTVGDLTLERIMADPQWIGRQPQNPYWSADGRSIFYERERLDSELRDLIQVDLDAGEQRILEPAERAAISPRRVRYSQDRTRAVHDRGGDLFLVELERGADGSLRQLSERQLTRTSARESSRGSNATCSPETNATPCAWRPARIPRSRRTRNPPGWPPMKRA